MIVTFVIPLQNNEGWDHDAKTFYEFEHALAELAGGLTHTHAYGLWLTPEGELQGEYGARYEVIIADDQWPRLSELLAQAKIAFRQRELLVWTQSITEVRL